MKAETKKEFKKFIFGCVKILSFFLVLIVVVQVLSMTLFSKKSATNYKTGLNKAYSFMQEPDNSIDVLGIGNSDLYSAVIPAEFWKKYGFTSSVIASPHQTPLQSYEILKEFYKKQNPKVVFIEVDMMYGDFVKNIKGIERKESLFSYVFGNFDADDFDDLIESRIPLFTFHDKWKKTKTKKKPDTPHSHGYKYSETVCDVNITEYMVETDKQEKIKNSSIEYVNKMIEYVESHGGQVFLTEMPTVNSWNTERHNAVAQYCKEINKDFIDCNLIIDELGIDLNLAFRDKGNHLNYYGARAVTDYMGKYIVSNYKMEDRRNDPAYKFYADSIKKFDKEVEVQREKEKNKFLKKQREQEYKDEEQL